MKDFYGSCVLADNKGVLRTYIGYADTIEEIEEKCAKFVRFYQYPKQVVFKQVGTTDEQLFSNIMKEIENYDREEQ